MHKHKCCFEGTLDACIMSIPTHYLCLSVLDLSSICLSTSLSVCEPRYQWRERGCEDEEEESAG